jgi:signal transduction histidine kinase
MARYALVIGIAEYTSPLKRLSKPATDAEAVAQRLKQHGNFQEVKLLNAEVTRKGKVQGRVTREKLEQALSCFLQEQAVKSEALVYFTGHGITVSESLGAKRGYLATSDCVIEAEGDEIIEQRRAITLDSLNTLIRNSDLSSLVVLLDCCHSGYFLERNLVEQTLTAFISHKDYYLIAACQEFEQAWAKKSHENSVFTGALLGGLASENADTEGQVSGDRLFDFIARELKGSGQEPIRMGWGRSLTLVQYQPKQTAVVVDETCPYQGLEAFGKEQARFFFGREKVVQLLVEKLGQSNFVPIIGASGSGKSSVVRAGLIPQLEKNGWRVMEPILPGVEPLAELKRALIQLFDRMKVREIYSGIETDGLRSVIAQLSSSERLLLVVDQFEEVFTICPNEEERHQFIKLLTQVAEIPISPLAIITTMRADFLEPCLSYESLTRLIQDEAVYMPPLVGAELEEAITKPANLQGYQLETGLLGAMLEDVGQEKGCLPLLQFALTELWEQGDRKAHQLKVQQYRQLGGVIAALNRHAEKLYENFTEQERGWVKQIFLKLVRTGAEGKDTRQRQPKVKLLTLITDDPFELQTINNVLIERLVQGRLLVIGQELEGEAWVDLAHEALMQGWRRFALWREENRELRSLTDRIEDALREWQKNPKDDNLMMGGLLAQVRKHWAELETNLSSSAKEFCRHSDAHEQEQRSLAELAAAEFRKALEKEKEFYELKSSFMSLVTHEFRTPLTIILSSAELLEYYSDRLSDEKKQKHLGRIQTSVTRMDQILQDVLTINSTEANRIKFEPVSIDLVGFCYDIIEEIQINLQPEYKLTFLTIGDYTNTQMDKKLLRQMLTNLLLNAIKFSPQGGVIQFDLICNSESAIFCIQDGGIGIPKEDQEQLFEAFHRASNVGKIDGTGLGLAIVKKCVDLHRGQIAVESEVGVGTTFTITLPLNYQTELNSSK